MSRIFLDTNIVLDYLMQRKEFQENAERILAMGQSGICELFLSSLSFSNIAYIARQLYKGSDLYDLLDAVRELVQVAPVDKQTIDKALALRAKDFEDAIQYFSAMSIGVDHIITRNKKDFSFSSIPVLTPQEFLTL